MKNNEVNFEAYKLNIGIPEINLELDETIDDEFDIQDLKEQFIRCLPIEVIHLGTIETDVDDNCRSWSINDDYYLLKLNDDIFDWAAFRLSWDDNWSQWRWCFDARIKGFQDEPSEAAKIILKSLWELWELDLNDPDYDLHKAFFMNLK
jgi:hypothetical protein